MSSPVKIPDIFLRSTLLIIGMVSVLYLPSFSQVKKDSLLNVLNKSVIPDTNTVLIHEKLAYYYRFVKPDSAFFHAQKALDLSRKLKFEYGIIYSLNHIGVYYQNRGQYNLAISYYNEAFSHQLKNTSSRLLKPIALAINNLGTVSLEKENYLLADYYFRKALSIDQSLCYSKGIARELGNLGKLKILQGKPDSALIFLNKALSYEKAEGHTIGMLETMVDIGKVHFQKGDYSEARRILKEASTLNKNCFLTANIWIDQLLGQIMLKEGDIPNAILLTERAFQCAGVLDNKILSIEIAATLARIYKLKGEYSKAFTFLDTVNFLSSELQKEKFEWMHADIIAGVESMNKKKEIELLHENRDKMMYYNSRLVSMRNGLVLSLCFCLVLGGIIYKAYRDKRSVNRVLMLKFSEIRSKNADIQNKSREIQEINTSLLATNETLNKREFQLKEAQRIAGVGSWEYDACSGKLFASENLKALFFLNQHDDRTINLRSYLRLIDPEDWPQVKSMFKKVLATGHPVDVEFSISGPDQERRYFNAKTFPLTSTEGELIQVYGTLLDTSAHMRAAMKLTEAKEHAEMASHSKSLFLANMSHEIRTPLNGILGFTNILLRECSIPQQREYLQHIRNSGDNLLVLLNDILDFNKIEHGKLEIEATNFQIRQLVDEAMIPYRLQAQEKGLNIKINCSPEVPANIIGDPHRTRQLLVNYVSNALKFTKSGTIVIDISLAEISVPDGHEMTLKFTVSDTGIGIPLEKQQYIFNAFTQADSSTTRNYGGTGLGLAINNQLTKLMGGSSGVQSPGILQNASNPGSDFWFTIKVKRGLYTESGKKNAAEAEVCCFKTPLKILVAEDNIINQMLMKKVLETMNCQVVMVENGKLAVEASRLEHFDAILLDIQMPVMDGLQAAMLIRQSGNCSIPVIGVSANVFKDDIEKSLAAGMDAHLGKPFDAKDLFRILTEKIKLKQDRASEA